MKIGLISDTHGSLSAWEKGLKVLSKSDIIVHGGDILYHGPRNPLPDRYDPQALSEALNNFDRPLFLVKGNCDAAVDEMVLDLPLITPFFYASIEGITILALHGDGYTEAEMFKLGKDYGAQVVVFGHIHEPLIKQNANGIVLVNPGSSSLPKGERPRSTVAMIDLEAKKIEAFDLKTDEIIETMNLGGSID